MDKVLHMIGLSYRAGAVAVGEEPAGAVARAKDARLILVAQDAAENTWRRAEHFAQAGQCICLRIPYSKMDLSLVSGNHGCAMLAITEIGLANAVVQQLARENPAYGDAAEKMQLKEQRARERLLEQKQHEKNLRLGKQSQPTKKEPQASSSRLSPAPASRAGSASPRKKPPVSRFAGSRPVTRGKGSPAGPESGRRKPKTGI